MGFETTISVLGNLAGILSVLVGGYVLFRKLEKRLDKIDLLEERLRKIEECLQINYSEPFKLHNNKQILKNGTRPS